MPPTTLPYPIDHLGIAVADLDAASHPYSALGLPRTHADEDVPDQQVRVRTFHGGGILLELLAPTAPESPIARFLERRGPGLHHMALRVDDLESEIERLRREGAEFIDTTPRPGRAGTRVAFLHPRWAGGVLIELVEHR